MPAAQMAFEDVNKQENLLAGYKLKLHSNDSEVTLQIWYNDNLKKKFSKI